MAISLKDARKKMRLTQEQVAKELSITRLTVANWEDGRSYPDAIKLKKLLELYGVKFENVDFCEHDEKRKSRFQDNGSDFQHKLRATSTRSVTELCHVLGIQPDEEE